LLDNHEVTLFNLENELSEYTDKLRLFVRDIKDKAAVERACDGVDYIFHTCALKRIELGEYNPWEYIATNVGGTQNIVDCGIDANVEKIMVISSDKSVAAVNVYGKTKALAESIAVVSNFYRGNRRTKIGVCRYGNVEASQGSVIPIWKERIEKGRGIVATDPGMTRFTISMEEALDFIITSTKRCLGGEIFIPKMKAYRLGDLLSAAITIAEKQHGITSVGIDIGQPRPGEKMDEALISKDEIKNTYDTGDGYIILPNDEYVKAFGLKCAEHKQYPHPVFSQYTSAVVERFDVDALESRMARYF